MSIKLQALQTLLNTIGICNLEAFISSSTRSGKTEEQSSQSDFEVPQMICLSEGTELPVVVEPTFVVEPPIVEPIVEESTVVEPIVEEEEEKAEGKEMEVTSKVITRATSIYSSVQPNQK
jgi:hypothetical protein